MKKFIRLSALVLITSLMFSCSTEKIASNNGYVMKHHDIQIAEKSQSPKVEKAIVISEEKSSVNQASELGLANNEAKTDMQTMSAPITKSIDSKSILNNKNLRQEIAKNTAKTKVVTAIKQAKTILHKKANRPSGGDVPQVLLIILCFLVPFLAVGLATDWDLEKVVINIILTLLCGIPGIIHALIVVLD